MPKQMDWTGEEGTAKPRRSRKVSGRAAGALPSELTPAEHSPQRAQEPAPGPQDIDPTAFAEAEHLRKKGLRVLPVVTGAVVDAAGNFLFYVDGHEDARSGVQAQLNHLLECGPSREEHLAPARARARYLAEKLAKPR